MDQKCSVKEKYCEGDWLDSNGKCVVRVFILPDERCKEALAIEKVGD